MKIKELVEKLSKFDPNLDVVCSCEDESIMEGRPGFKLFEIQSVDSAFAEKCRTEDGTPSFRYGRSGAATEHVVLDITADF